jgi:sodium/potassium-transporting ATPase subunit alpha
MATTTGDGSGKAASPGGGGGAYDADEHLLSVAEVAARYGTHVDAAHPDASRGLTEAEVPALRAKYGRNAMTPPKKTPEWLLLLRHFANPLLLMLTLACLLTFLVYGVQSPREVETIILASAMAGVIVLLALTSYYQERSAGNVMGE